MRNALLLVALFLGGITTQAIAQRHDGVVVKKGNKHRYYKSQSVRFVENGVLFTVYTDGTFSFTDQFYGKPYRKNRRVHKMNYYGKSRQHGKYRRGYRPIRVDTDPFGNIIGVNGICISYKRNGKVKQIGTVPIFHKRGYMVQVGGMTLQYDRFGNIRNRFGIINRHNDDFWHTNWYTYNDYGDDDWDDDWDDDDRHYGRRNKIRKTR